MATSYAATTAVAVVAALLAARGERRWAYGASKAVASAGFLGVAWSVGTPFEGWRGVAFLALALSAVGDVALAGRGKVAFIVGLAGFMAAHAAYAVAFGRLGARPEWLALTVPLAVAVAALAWWWLRTRVSRTLRVPVAAYIAVVSAMAAIGVAAGLSHGAASLALGVALVAGSDAAVARHRFVAPGLGNKLVGLPAYYLGQLLIAFSLGGG